jgi:CheY-like chemotaxis protein
MLREKRASESEDKLLGTIQTSAQRGADIVKKVLTFARGVEGERVSLQPRSLLAEIEKIAAETFPKNIAFHCEATRDLWSVIGDATQLHQVLMNLCVNARDAMPEGGTLTVSAANVRVAKAKAGLFADGQAGPHVLLQVSDTGGGIPAAILEKVFDPFFTTKDQGKGTGLGLSTVLGIVRSHGGFLDVQSEPGKGSSFKVYLPAKPSEVVLRLSPTRPDCPPTGEGELVLVVDDEAEVRAMTEQTLTQHGYQVVSVTNGKEALDLISSHPGNIEAVITDLMMPVMDGMALARHLRQGHPRLPIIAVTGWAQEGFQAKLKDLGVQSFLQKPFSSEELLTSLRNRLNGAKATSGSN